MALLITGGGGFVMSNLARLWLEEHRADSVVILDSGPLDPALARFFQPVAERLIYMQASVLDRSALDRIAAEHSITHVVHAATVTLFAPQSPDGTAVNDPEIEVPAKMLEVNIMGAVTLLDWARLLPDLKRFINMSSGAVYNDYGPEPAGPMPEDGWVDPPEFYGISKLASELIGKRYAKLFGISVAACRLSGVYGPMDRARPSRAHYCIPYVVVHRALKGLPIRINAPDAVGDHIHALDVSRALMALLDKDGPLQHEVYNIAYGEAVRLQSLLETVADIIPATQWHIAEPAECDVVADPSFKGGRWGAYDISRISQETGWRPMPLREALSQYADFIRSFGVTA